ncbi:MAG: cell division ATP-binding protein FtsE [Patescibacteria group bacterium]
MITLETVTKIYQPNITVLEDLSLRIEPGEFVFLVGKSGAGKSTIVRLITAEERPSSGTVEVNGLMVSKLPSYKIPSLRRQIGVVYQDFKLLEQKTVYENIAFALEVCGESGTSIRSVVPQVISIVGLEGKEGRYPRHLSGGEQQRVAIARALVHRPHILIADEPTGDLDALTSRGIVDVLVKINDLGTTLVFVTHNKDVVNMLKKRVISIKDGRVVSDREGGKYFI